MSPWTWESKTHVFLLRSILLNCWYNLLTTIKFADLLTKFADDNLICWQQKFADKICWHFDFAYRICWQTEKFADKERPCRLGWINKIAKIVASRQSEDGWRQRSSMSQITAGTCLGRTFLEGPAIRAKSWIKELCAPAGRETSSDRCLAGAKLDVPAWWWHGWRL